jgi:hypothetical protein
MSRKPMVQRLEHSRGRPNLIGEGRQAYGDTLAAIAFDLPVQRLMLSVLFEQHHCQKTGPGPAAGHHMERRGGWLIFSQSRQATFSRTVWMTVRIW